MNQNRLEGRVIHSMRNLTHTLMPNDGNFENRSGKTYYDYATYLFKKIQTII
jgi:hypothetical protein